MPCQKRKVWVTEFYTVLLIYHGPNKNYSIPSKKKEKTIESPTNIRTKCYCAHSTKEQYDVEKKNLIDKTTKTFLGRVQTATQKG